MPTNITPSSVFTAPVQMPTDGETADASDFLTTTIQPIVNRTEHNKDRLDDVDDLIAILQTVARYSLSGTGVASGALATVGTEQDPDNAFALASNQVTFPAATGWYLITIYWRGTCSSTTDGVRFGVDISWNGGGGPEFNCRVRRPTATAADECECSASLVSQVSANAILNAKVSTSAGTMTILDGYVSIHRIR